MTTATPIDVPVWNAVRLLAEATTLSLRRLRARATELLLELGADGADERREEAKRAADVLAYFDRPGTSNGPTEGINGRLEHLRGSALGFRNLTNYIAYAEIRISDGMSPSWLC